MIPQPVNLRVDPFEQHVDAPSYPWYVGEKLWTVQSSSASSRARVALSRGLTLCLEREAAC